MPKNRHTHRQEMENVILYDMGNFPVRSPEELKAPLSFTVSYFLLKLLVVESGLGISRIRNPGKEEKIFILVVAWSSPTIADEVSPKQHDGQL